jgi:hypothetical protein
LFGPFLLNRAVWSVLVRDNTVICIWRYGCNYEYSLCGGAEWVVVVVVAVIVGGDVLIRSKPEACQPET